MKYFIDTEFKEKPNTIDLISIGIVCEDGREYYALNKECNLKEIWKDEWLRKNVLLPIYIEHVHGDMRNRISFSRYSIKGIFNGFGKTINEIAEDIKDFVSQKKLLNTITDEYATHNLKSTFEGRMFVVEHNFKKPEFYGYYADYDWVVFCWIFGRMIDLPKGFPMYCKDLKQMMDDKGLDENWKRKNCPDPEGEHNALEDAKWNLKLYNAINGNTPV